MSGRCCVYAPLPRCGAFLRKIPSPRPSLRRLGRRGGTLRCKNTLPCRPVGDPLRGCSCCPTYWRAAHQCLDARLASPTQGAHHIVVRAAGRLRQPLPNPLPSGLPWCLPCLWSHGLVATRHLLTAPDAPARTPCGSSSVARLGWQGARCCAFDPIHTHA
jgi:hypothetical protein